jgi:hypothetical protein
MSARLITRGWTLDRAREIVMLISALSMAASLPAIVAPTPLGFVLFISLATLGHGRWAHHHPDDPGRHRRATLRRDGVRNHRVRRWHRRNHLYLCHGKTGGHLARRSLDGLRRSLASLRVVDFIAKFHRSVGIRSGPTKSSREVVSQEAFSPSAPPGSLRTTCRRSQAAADLEPR